MKKLMILLLLLTNFAISVHADETDDIDCTHISDVRTDPNPNPNPNPTPTPGSDTDVD